MLVSSLAGLTSCQELCDTVLVCGDGRLLASSLLLTPVIPWLSSLLDSVLRIDAYKTVILPRELSVSSVQLMVELVTSTARQSYTAEQLRDLKQVCSVLDCRPVLDLLGQMEGLALPTVETVKRKAASPLKRKSKQPRLGSGSGQVGSALSPFPALPPSSPLPLVCLFQNSCPLSRLSCR